MIVVDVPRQSAGTRTAKVKVMPTLYQVEHLYGPEGWLSPGYLEVGDDGMIARTSGKPTEECEAVRLAGYGVPGLCNLHSHAFQRALAARTEFVTSHRTEDNLWNWRQEMYRFVGRLTPDDYEALASLVYLEMLQFGTTSVCEFHYVHHQPDGHRYIDPAEMSDRLIAAADRVGLGMTLLPALYVHGGIGRPPEGAQRRFVLSVDDYLGLVADLRSRCRSRPTLQIGIALHSLRAVAPGELLMTLAGVSEIDPASKVHIHVAETIHEVAEIETKMGARPVQWLLDNVELSNKWCLVHATHLDASEIAGTADSGAVAGLCPLTEAMLGDGYFPLLEYHSAGGSWGIGTDSHCSTSIAEELRILECGKRLQLRRRNVIAQPESGGHSHTGRVLFDSALAGGQRASGQGGGAFLPGRRADLVVLEADSNVLLGHGPDTALDAWILGGTQNPVRDVMVAGKWVIRDGQHPEEANVRAAYQKVMARLMR